MSKFSKKVGFYHLNRSWAFLFIEFGFFMQFCLVDSFYVCILVLGSLHFGWRGSCGIMFVHVYGVVRWPVRVVVALILFVSCRGLWSWFFALASLLLLFCIFVFCCSGAFVFLFVVRVFGVNVRRFCVLCFMRRAPCSCKSMFWYCIFWVGPISHVSTKTIILYRIILRRVLRTPFSAFAESARSAFKQPKRSSNANILMPGSVWHANWSISLRFDIGTERILSDFQTEHFQLFLNDFISVHAHNNL